MAHDLLDPNGFLVFILREYCPRHCASLQAMSKGPNLGSVSPGDHEPRRGHSVQESSPGLSGVVQSSTTSLAACLRQESKNMGRDTGESRDPQPQSRGHNLSGIRELITPSFAAAKRSRGRFIGSLVERHELLIIV